MQTVHHSQTCLHVHMDTMHVENIDVQVQLQAHSLTHMHRCNQSSKNVVEARPARKMHVWLEYADTQWMPGSCRLKHHMLVRARNSPPMLLVMTTLPCLLRFSKGYAARTVWKTPSTFVAKMLCQLSSLVSWGACICPRMPAFATTTSRWPNFLQQTRRQSTPNLSSLVSYAYMTQVAGLQ